MEFLAPTWDMICIEDIAHGLSLECRFARQCKKFVSVAEHSVLMCENYGWNNEDAFALLMHDASEAYTGDMPTMMKRAIPDFKRIEEAIQDTIDHKYSVIYNNVVKNWDSRFMIDENAQNMTRGPNEIDFGDLTPLGIKLKFWTPEEAEGRFLQNFHRLSRVLGRVAA